MAAPIVNEHVRYEPEENPPPLIALGAGAQAAMLIVAPVVLTVVIVVRIAEASESYLAWAIFAAMAVCGVTTVLQAARWGRFRVGARADHGHVGGFYRRLCRCAGVGRAGDAGESCGHIFFVPVHAGGQALAAPAHIHANCNWYRDNAHCSYGGAGNLRLSGQCS